jgi:hypothetical protein
VASLTCWQRLEPRSRSTDIADGLQAEIRDPLWLLGRQWQVGEFTGIDSGSPVAASFRDRTAPLTAYENASSFTSAGEAVGAMPLETHVEREPVSLGVRASTQLGLHFEAQLHASAITGTAGLIAGFREAYPINAPDTDPSYDAVPDQAGRQYTTAVYGRVTDGLTLYADARANLPSTWPKLPALAQAVFSELLPLLEAFVAYYESLYSQPTADSAWSPNPTSAGASSVGWLNYEFAIASGTDWMDLGFSAPAYRGGKLDWYSFIETSAPAAAAGAPPAPPSTVAYRTLMPTHVTFKGMPTGTFWTFEDGLSDFGQLSTNLVDLPTMLITEFSVLYGGDWFTVPVQQPFGTVSQIDLVVVTDTFAQRTLIRPTGEAQPSSAPQATTAGARPPAQPWQQTTKYNPEQLVLYAGQLWWALTIAPGGSAPGSDYTIWFPWTNPWTMFTITGEPTSSDLLLIPPTLGTVQDGHPLETVDFLRDDAAALAWGLERTLQGALDIGVDAYEWYLQRANSLAQQAVATQMPGGPTLSYLLGTSIPDNWIPLVPEQTSDGTLLLRRGALYRIDTTQTPPTVPIPPRGQILQPASPDPAPLFLADQAVPQAGVHVQRYFRRARWTDGSTHMWIARRVETGYGPGQSGLAFDVVEPVAPPPPPTLTSVNPASGAAAGGTAITLAGNYLSGATAVRFGSTPATTLDVKSDTEITVTSPAGTGTVQVTVTTPSGTATTTAQSGFVYE